MNLCSLKARRRAQRIIGSRPATALSVLIGWAVLAPAASAVTVKIDYAYDTSSFFANNVQAFNALEAAASFYSNLLTDTFSSIQTPPNQASSQFNGVAFWSWSL